MQIARSDQLHVSDTHVKASRNKSGAIHSLGDSENLVDRINIDANDPERCKPFSEENRMTHSDSQIERDILVDQLKMDVKNGDSIIGDVPNDDAKKSRDGQSLKPSSGKRRHDEEREKQNADSWKDNDEEHPKANGKKNILGDKTSNDFIIENIDTSGGGRSQVLNDRPSSTPVLHEKKKRKKRRKDESNKCYIEGDAAMDSYAIDINKDSTLDLGPSKEVIEDTLEKTLSIGNTGLRAGLVEKPSVEKITANSTNGNHVDANYEDPSNDGKRNKRRFKKQPTKDDQSNYDSGAQDINDFPRKPASSKTPGDESAHDLENLCMEPDGDIVSEEVPGLGNASNIVPEVPDTDAITNSNRSIKELLHSREDETLYSAENVHEDATKPEKLSKDKCEKSGRREKKSSKSKQSSIKPSQEDVPRVVIPAIDSEKSNKDTGILGSGSGIINFYEAFCPRENKEGILNTEDEQIGTESHKRKTEEGDAVDCAMQPRYLIAKKQKKSRKQITGDAPNDIHKNDRRNGECDVSHVFSYSHSKSLESSQDHQIYENNGQSADVKLKRPKHRVEVKTPVDDLQTSDPVSHYQTHDLDGDFSKEMSPGLASPDDNTEDDSNDTRRFRVAVRKVPKRRAEKVLKKADPNISLKPADDIFCHVLGSGLADKPAEGNIVINNKDASHNAQASADLEEFSRENALEPGT